MKAIWLLEDTVNSKLKGYISLLAKNNIEISKILTTNPNKNHWGISQQTIKPNIVGGTNILLKISYLFGQSVNSLTDIHFPKRNVYSYQFISGLINIFWLIKLKWFNKVLPSYTKTIKLLRGRRNSKNCCSILQGIDCIVVDSLWIRNINFLDLILYSKRKQIKVVVYVSSWDNSFYSQFIDLGDIYLVWSQMMMDDLKTIQKIEPKEWIFSGPIIFNKFYQISKTIGDISSDRTITYAFAFADSIMLPFEVSFVKLIASSLQSIGWKLIVRPYPTTTLNELSDLNNIENVEIYTIPSAKIDRYGDGKELISFSSEEERLGFLLKGRVFLSLGTSFTIEASLSNIPIFHLVLDEKASKTESIIEIAKRINLSDHIMRYYNTSFENISSPKGLKLRIEQLEKDDSYNEMVNKNTDFKFRIGVNHLEIK